MNNEIFCPFCGQNITKTYSLKNIIPQEETIRTEHSLGYTWAGSYRRTTKYQRKFDVLCCEDCYTEFKNAEILTLNMSKVLAPIGFIIGIVYCIYYRNTNNFEFGIGAIFHCIWFGILGIFIFSIPTLLVNLLLRKKTSYKKAKKCNAVI